jgi:hypothetical protein
MLGSFDDILHGYLGRIASEQVAAMRSARAGNQAGAAELEEDLFHVIRGKALVLGHIAGGQRPVTPPLGEVQGNDQTVFRPRSYAQ